MASLQAHHVLVVDDDRDMRALLRMGLEAESYSVDEADNGAAALTMLRTSAHPLVVVLDLQMPGMDGQQLLEAVAADETVAQRHAYLLVTASPTLGLTGPLGELLTQLRVPVLPKPFALDALLEMVAQAASCL